MIGLLIQILSQSIDSLLAFFSFTNQGLYFCLISFDNDLNIILVQSGHLDFEDLQFLHMLLIDLIEFVF